MKLFLGPLSIKLGCLYVGINDKKRTKNPTFAEEINYQMDLNYMNDNSRSHRFDILTPINNYNGRTIIDIHGGAYVYGYKENNFEYCTMLAKHGYKVINMNYTLYRGKTGVDDSIREIHALLNYLYDRRDEYNIDFDNIILMGDSCGAHLAFLTYLSNQVKELQDLIKIKPLDMNVTHLVFSSPVYDYYRCSKWIAKFLSKRGQKYVGGSNYQDAEFLEKLSPRYYIENKKYDYLPKIFASTSYVDFLKEDAFDLKKDLNDLVTLEYSPIHLNKVNHVYNVVDTKSYYSRKTNNALIKFLAKVKK